MSWERNEEEWARLDKAAWDFMSNGDGMTADECKFWEQAFFQRDTYNTSISEMAHLADMCLMARRKRLREGT